MDKKRLAINMAAQLLAFAVNMGISFFLAPIIDVWICDACQSVCTVCSDCSIGAQHHGKPFCDDSHSSWGRAGGERIFLLCIFRECDHGWHFPAAGTGDRDLYGELAVPACSGGCSA